MHHDGGFDSHSSGHSGGDYGGPNDTVAFNKYDDHYSFAAFTDMHKDGIKFYSIPLEDDIKTPVG